MTTINPYLNFPGNAEEAFKFYQSIFGGEFLGGIHRFGDMPMEGQPDIPEADKNKVMHIALPIGQNLLMASDALESMGQKLTTGNAYYVSINADSKEETDRIYSGLSTGGDIEMPIGNAPWGAYFGMFKDQFGIRWMVSFEQGNTE